MNKLLTFLLLGLTASLTRMQAAAISSTPNGILYQHIQIIKPCPAVIHIITLEPEKINTELIKSNNQCKGLAKVSDLVKKHGAYGGINGGFFQQDGTPSGICKISKTWYTSQKIARAALGWRNDGSTWLIDIIDTQNILTIGKQQFPVHHLNQQRKPHETVVYTPAFDATTGTNDDGIEIICEDNIVTQVVVGHGNNQIPSNGFIYSIGKDVQLSLTDIHPGLPSTFNIKIIPLHTSAEQWDNMDFIIGGTPLLIFDGNHIEDFSQEKTLQNFLVEKYARTAVGITHDNHIIFVAVEHINTENNNGMTMQELALLMKDLHCNYALNLSGGHSSTLILQQNMRNNPHEAMSLGGLINWEKDISNALIVKSKASN